MLTLEISTTVGASPEEVWAHASTMEGVNWELAPWVRMSVPREAKGRTLTEVPVGEEAFRSVLLLGGVIPFDVHHLRLERVLARGFDEESWSWLQRRWRHERRIDSTEEGGAIIIDRLTVETRFAPIALVAPLIRAIFRWRHRRLRKKFGGAAPTM
jgi:ligand-binding SRPBCC domain-containing protein